MPVALITQLKPTAVVIPTDRMPGGLGKYNQYGDLCRELSALMEESWRSGRPISVDRILGDYPELADNAAGAVRLIRLEIALRKKYEGVDAFAEYIARYPQYRDELEAKRLKKVSSIDVSGDPVFPEVGEQFGDFHLVSELGRGAKGRVFLATQNALADRPLVLKMTAQSGEEHLSLARLQHTHIVPLYAVHDSPSRNLRILFFPYQGGATWDRVLEQLSTIPCAERTGRHISEFLDQANKSSPIQMHSVVKSRKQLIDENYVRAVCRIGVRLAETLYFAHERGLLHLDVKPSNILLAGDGEPMLLDFHLAQSQLGVDDAPRFFGGTPPYMAPEQERVCEAMDQGQPTPNPVDRRADVYALGVVLYEALGGSPKLPAKDRIALYKINPNVDLGLSDVIAKCIDEIPENRYIDADAMAVDLQRYLDHMPMRGVNNRSLAERWTKWRRRRPWVLPWILLGLLLVIGLVFGGIVGYYHFHAKRQQAESALATAHKFMGEHRYDAAVQTLTAALRQTSGIGADAKTRQTLRRHLRLAELARKAQELHQWTESLRAISMMDTLPPRTLVLTQMSKTVWNKHKSLSKKSSKALGLKIAQQWKKDLHDLAFGWTDMHVRLAPPDRKNAHIRQALRFLDDVEKHLGSNLALHLERHRFAKLLGDKGLAEETGRQIARIKPETAWDHFVVGRALYRNGQFQMAADSLAKAANMQPTDFWIHFVLGACQARLNQHADSVQALSVCIGHSPDSAMSFFARGNSFSALGKWNHALSDFQHALRLDPNGSAIHIERAAVYRKSGKFESARTALVQAESSGAKPAVVHYHEALLFQARGDMDAAQKSVQLALRHDPHFAPAVALAKALGGRTDIRK